jgi:tetratricopeptide (TPR) repeat protein
LARKAQGTDLSNLALLYLELKRYPDAEKAYERALPIEIKAYGQDDHVVRDAMNGYAMTLRNLHREDEARKIEDHLRATGSK